MFVRYYTPNREASSLQKEILLYDKKNHRHIQLNHVSTDGEEDRKGSHPPEEC